MRNLGLATVVFREDVRLLDIQLASIEHYLAPEGFCEFIIIDNSPPNRCLGATLNSMTRSRLGTRWRRRVRIVRGPSTIPYSDGYRRQQVLKLWVAAESAASAMVILDAKNSFVGHCSASNIMRDGRPRIAQFNEGRDWLAGLNSANRCWGLPEYRDGDWYAGPYTPFVFIGDEVRSMLRKLAEQLAGPRAPIEIAWEGFCFAPSLMPATEFLLYSQYLVSKYGGLAEIYQQSSPMSVTLFEHLPDAATALSALSAAGPLGVKIIGIHRRRIPALSPALLEQLDRLWAPLGIDPRRAFPAKSLSQRRRSLLLSGIRRFVE